MQILKLKDGVDVESLRKYGFKTGKEWAAQGERCFLPEVGMSYQYEWFHVFAMDEEEPEKIAYTIKERISKFLDEELQLALNKKTCIRPVSMGIQFVGLHIWSTHRTVRKSTSLRIKRRLKAAAKQYVAGNLTYERYNSTLQSYMGMMKHNDCYRFKMQLLEDVETIINESGVAA